MSQTVKEAALQVFTNLQKPLHYKELTRLIINECNLGGKTPHETVRSLVGTDERFKRVAEGIYALSEWKDYPVARFAKDIAYDVVKEYGKPINLTQLGESIYRERVFKGPSKQIARNAIRKDKRFRYNQESELVSLTEWFD